MEDEDVVVDESGTPGEETGKEQEATESSTEASRADKGRGGFQARISELTAKAKTYEAELEETRAAVKERDKEVQDLIELLKEKEEASKSIQRIQELHATDPDMRDLIELLDKRMRGEEVEVPKKDQADTKDAPSGLSAKEAKELLRTESSKLTEEMAEMRAELLLGKAETLIEKFLDDLPETYSDVDRNRINGVLASHINWEGIEDNPGQISKLVQEGVQKAVEWYGQPAAAPSNDNKGQETKPALSTAERLDKLKNQDFAKTKEVKTPRGQTRKVPEMSDKDFAAALGEALRLEREQASGR